MGARTTEGPRAIDFATHNVFGDELSEGERRECVDTLRELVGAFGSGVVVRAVEDIVGKAGQGATGEGVDGKLQVLRAFCVLLEEADRPRLAARLVGKLCRLELATGRRISYRELGRAWGTSKQAVQRRGRDYCARLGIPALDSTAESRESARLMNRRNYGGRGMEKAAP
jgi:hypothetical protein